VADITITCPSCGRPCTVSEFTAAETLACPACSHRLELPNVERGMKLKVRKGAAGESVNLTNEPLSSVLTSAEKPDDRPASTINEVHKVRGQVKSQKKWLGWLLFLLLGGLLVGAQYYIQQDLKYLDLYHKASWVIYGIVFLAVLMVAADDSYLQAVLCVLVPCYVIYYAFSRMESNALRGLFLAVVVSLGAELYFLKDQALLMILQRQLNAFIDYVSQLIKRAGESPDMPQPGPKVKRLRS
jgi:hypothetical protein